MIPTTQPKTLMDMAIAKFRQMAKDAPTWQDWWAAAMNYTRGNTSGIVLVCEHAGVSTTDINHAWLQLRTEAN